MHGRLPSGRSSTSAARTASVGEVTLCASAAPSAPVFRAIALTLVLRNRQPGPSPGPKEPSVP